MSEVQQNPWLRVDRFEELRIVEMSGVDDEHLVYEAEHRGAAIIGFRPDPAAGVLVSFAPQLAGMEISVDVLRALFYDVEDRMRQERLENEVAEDRKKVGNDEEGLAG
jgi:hypothetical protein